MKRTTERLRRAKKTRCTIKRLGVPRISVDKTGQHIYAQLIDVSGNVLAAASTITKDFKAQQQGKQTKTDAAAWVGAEIAKRTIALGIKKIAFDRSGFKYHGRIMKLADAARAGGLQF